MKNIFLFSFLFFSGVLNAQFCTTCDTVNFENTNNYLITIDTSQPNNIWQIGKPQKVFFDSSLSLPNAIVTDTINPYPTNNLSSFQFTIKEPAPNTWGNNLVPGFVFLHKFETDSLYDGGYIEASYDGGSTWISLANGAPEIFCINGCYNDTIQGGIRAFTGASGWSWIYMHWYGWCSMTPSQVPADSIIVRFTFKSDGIQTNKEGWMIDDIRFGLVTCYLGVGNPTSFGNAVGIYPNPSSTVLSVEYKMYNGTIQVQITDVAGQEIKSVQMNSPQMQIDISSLASGTYFVNLKTDKGIIARKIMVVR